MNVTEPIWRNCAAYPERTAIVFEGKAITYAALARSVAVASGRLAAAGVRRGDVVALGIRSPAAFIVVLLSLARMGVTATPYKASWTGAMKLALMGRNRVKTLVRDAGDDWLPPAEMGIRCMPVLALFGPLRENDAGHLPPMADVNDEWWWIALSSGTTGVPKSIPHSHRHFRMSLRMQTRFAHPDQKRVMVFIDLATTMGLSSTFRTLSLGNTLILTGRSDPGQFFETIRRDRPTRVLTSTGLASGMVRHALAHSIDRAACQSIIAFQVGGSLVPPGLRRNIGAVFCDNLEVSYGSTELPGIALIDDEAYRMHPDSAGKVYPWVRAQATDEQDRPLPPGAEGLLRFKSDLMTRNGYLDDPEATARAFRNGWFYPGDRGRVDEGGFVFLAGRSDNLVNVGGQKVNAEAIEAVLNSHPGVLECAVIGAPVATTGVDVLVAAVVLQGEAAAGDLRELCRARLGPQFVPMHVMFVDELPKNDGGKVMRDRLKEGLLVARREA